MHDGCPKFIMPKSNIEYWKPKLERNKRHDIENKIALEKQGWKVIVVWECDLKKDKKDGRLMHLVEEIIENKPNGVK